MRKVTKIKIRYYSREILKYLLLAGVVYIAASSPYFALNLFKNVSKLKNISKKKSVNIFNYLRRRGLIEIKREGHDVRITLTKEGKKQAGGESGAPEAKVEKVKVEKKEEASEKIGDKSEKIEEKQPETEAKSIEAEIKKEEKPIEEEKVV